MRQRGDACHGARRRRVDLVWRARAGSAGPCGSALAVGLSRPAHAAGRGDDARQLAAGAAGRRGNRALARLRLHHLRRPAQLHVRAAALGARRLRHPGGDADRLLADRRELRHRHGPQGRAPRRHECARGNAGRGLWRGPCRPRLLLGAQPLRRHRPYGRCRRRPPTAGRLAARGRCGALFPDGSGPARAHRSRREARRRHRPLLRAGRPPHRRQRGAVGDAARVHGRLGALLLRFPLQCDLPRRAEDSAPPRSAP